jgi:hypothetical protein
MATRKVTNATTRVTCMLALAVAPAGFAAAQADIPDGAREFVEYMADFDARHPDPTKVDIDAVVEAEGEQIALLYCRAIGFDGPCAPDERSRATGFVAASGRNVSSALPWWSWLWNFTRSIGVLRHTMNCGPYAPVAIGMDDASPPSSGGWLGVSTATTDTTWRLCKVNWPAAWQFRRLSTVPNLHLDYAVQRLGLQCPPWSTAVLRYQHNVPGNTNNQSGPIFPNFRVPNGGWFFWTCNFDNTLSPAPLPAQLMTSFPTLAIPAYGVYASRGLFQPYFPSLANGYIYQRDFATGWWWWGSPSANPSNWVMQGSANHTMRFLARVQ